MANEAIIVKLYGSPPGEPQDVTVAAATSLSKGALLAYTADPNTCAITSGVSNAFVGVLAMDKDGADPSTKVSVYTNLDADLVCVSAGNLPFVGDAVELSGTNLIRAMTQNSISGASFVSGASSIVGISRETASANERITVRIRK